MQNAALTIQMARTRDCLQLSRYSNVDLITRSFADYCRRGSRPIIDTVANAVGVSPSTAAFLAALALLLPAENPPLSFLDALHTQAHNDGCAQMPERCFELVLAWGCGRRPVTVLYDHSDQNWSMAVMTLARLNEPLVRTVLRQLADLRLPTPINARLDELLYNPVAGECSYAAILAMDLVNNTVLAKWQPHRHHLTHYLLQQFGGTLGSGALRSAAFTSKMLYPLLREELGLIEGTVVFKVCDGPTCHGDRISAAQTRSLPIQISELDGRGLFEGAACATCGRLARTHATYSLPRRHWLFVPSVYGGPYEQRLFMNCTACGHHFPCSAPYIDLYQSYEQLRSVSASAPTELQRHLLTQTRSRLSQARAVTACPLCRRYAVSQRPVQLWVYAPTGVFSGSIDG